jgi:hypothetical protein
MKSRMLKIRKEKQMKKASGEYGMFHLFIGQKGEEAEKLQPLSSGWHLTASIRE